MNKNLNYWAVLPAAGSGQRMNSAVPKQYLSLCGKTIIEHTIERLTGLSYLEKLMVVVAEDDSYWPTMPVFQHEKLSIIQGGAERFQSVLCGLRALKPLAKEDDWVLVHDVARPCVRLSDILRLIHEVKNHAVGGILACPALDTMKESARSLNNTSYQVCRTVSRENLWHALTPQMFRFGILLDALETVASNGAVVTDEASAVESKGYAPLLVTGARDNIKITYSEDLPLARFFLEQQAEKADL